MSQTDLEKAQAQIDQLLHDRAELLRQLQISEDQRQHIVNFGTAWNRLQNERRPA